VAYGETNQLIEDLNKHLKKRAGKEKLSGFLDPCYPQF